MATNDTQRAMIAQLKVHEGYRNKMYVDTTGHATIGYGFNLAANELPFEVLEYLFWKEYIEHKLALVKALPWVLELDDVRQGILVDMAYNLGVDGLLKFKNTLGCVERGDYEGAAKGMENSLWYRQVGSRGVTLVRQMRTGAIK